jgi:hypothetical protein
MNVRKGVHVRPQEGSAEGRPGVGQTIVALIVLVLFFAGMWAIFALWVHELIENWTVAGIVSGTLILFYVQQIFFDELFGGRGEAVWKVLDKVFAGNGE